MMISAKIFENEEEVKTFKKHAKYSSKSISYLKGVELELLGKLNWNLPHFCCLDYALYYFSNFLFRESDLIHVSRKHNLEYQWNDFHSLVGQTLRLTPSEMNFVKVFMKNSKRGKQWSKVFVRVKDVDSQDFEKLSEEIFKNYESIIKGVNLQFACKSELRVILTVYILICLKQYHIGQGFLSFHFVKEYFCTTIKE
jgi:hypothetical protein